MNACPNCGAPQPPELSIKAKDGQSLTMLSCPRCEARSWFADGVPVDRGDAIRLTAGDPAFELRASTRGQPQRR